MITITEYSVEQVKDPFDILAGERYEFFLDIDVPEDDELHNESGLYIRVIYRVEEGKTGIAKYELFEKTTDRYLGMMLEEEELEAINLFCREHLEESAER